MTTFLLKCLFGATFFLTIWVAIFDAPPPVEHHAGRPFTVEAEAQIARFQAAVALNDSIAEEMDAMLAVSLQNASYTSAVQGRVMQNLIAKGEKRKKRTSAYKKQEPSLIRLTVIRNPIE